MKMNYDPELGLFINIPVYDPAFALKLINFCVKEWERYDYNEEMVEAIIVAIIQNKGGRQ